MVQPGPDDIPSIFRRDRCGTRTGSLASFAERRGPLKIGVVYVSPIAEIGWTKQHSLGVDAIKKEFGDKVP